MATYEVKRLNPYLCARPRLVQPYFLLNGQIVQTHYRVWEAKSRAGLGEPQEMLGNQHPRYMTILEYASAWDRIRLIVQQNPVLGLFVCLKVFSTASCERRSGCARLMIL